MLIDHIKIGDRLEISLKRDNELGRIYVSQVSNILDTTQVTVMMPISYGKLVKLPIGPGFMAIFFTEKGMLRFDVSVVKYIKEDQFNMVVLKLESGGEKMQRRNFFRYQCMLPMKFSVINETDLESEGKDEVISEMFDGITKDMGGGGVRFVTNAEIDGKATINVIIMLGDKEYCVAIAKVLYTLRFPTSAYKFQYRTKFVSILPEEQEKIVQFIFNQQRKKQRLV